MTTTDALFLIFNQRKNPFIIQPELSVQTYEIEVDCLISWTTRKDSLLPMISIMTAAGHCASWSNRSKDMWLSTGRTRCMIGWYKGPHMRSCFWASCYLSRIQQHLVNAKYVTDQNFAPFPLNFMFARLISCAQKAAMVLYCLHDPHLFPATDCRHVLAI